MDAIAILWVLRLLTMRLLTGERVGTRSAPQLISLRMNLVLRPLGAQNNYTYTGLILSPSSTNCVHKNHRAISTDEEISQ